VNTFSDEFKIQALRKLQENGGNWEKTAREMKISKNTLKGWARPAKVPADLTAVLFASLQKELKKIFNQVIRALPPKLKDASVKELLDVGTKVTRLITEIATLTPPIVAAPEQLDKKQLLEDLKQEIARRNHYKKTVAETDSAESNSTEAEGEGDGEGDIE
jgi:transposase-like protein